MSPETLLNGKKQPDLSIKRVHFGSYALIYTGTNNNMSKRSTPSIALSESNGAGGFYFMSLYSGKRLHSNKWTELPPDEGIIQKVMDWADAENQPLLSDGSLSFELIPGIALNFEEMQEEESRIAEDDANEINGNANYEAEINESQPNVISDDESETSSTNEDDAEDIDEGIVGQDQEIPENNSIESEERSVSDDESVESKHKKIVSIVKMPKSRATIE